MTNPLFGSPSEMVSRPKHTIQFYGQEDDIRTSWECGCGAAGSAPTYRVEEAAERHLPDNAQVVYRHPSSDWKW